MSKSDAPQGQDQPPWWKRIPFQLIVEIFVLVVGIKVAYIYSGQLDQMVENNRISRESLQSVQRAFVSVNPVPEMQTAADETGRQYAWFDFWLENSGSTPTRNLVAHINWVKGNSLNPPPDNFAYTDAQSGDGTTDTAVSVIGPKDKTPLIVGPIPREFIEKLYRHEVRLFVYGWARYNDLFTGTPRHVTKFSYELIAVQGVTRLQTGKEGQGLRTQVSGTRFNCYDEECKE